MSTACPFKTRLEGRTGQFCCCNGNTKVVACLVGRHGLEEGLTAPWRIQIKLDNKWSAEEACGLHVWSQRASGDNKNCLNVYVRLPCYFGLHHTFSHSFSSSWMLIWLISQYKVPSFVSFHLYRLLLFVTLRLPVFLVVSHFFHSI